MKPRNSWNSIFACAAFAALTAIHAAHAAPRIVATNAPATYPFFGILGDVLLYEGNAEASGKELWRSDGTAAGTFLVKDLFAGSNSSHPMEFTVVNETAFFTARDEAHGQELWKSSGTEGSTALVKDIVPGMGASLPISLTDIDGTLYFAAHDGTQGMVLRSDGSAAGTLVLRDGLPPGGGNLADGFTSLNGLVIFAASDGSDNGSLKLWRTDGSPGGTQPIGSTVGVVGGAFVPANGSLFFTGHTGDFVPQVWKSDGTLAGTIQVSNLPSGVMFATQDYGVSNLTAIGDIVYFVGNDGSSGRELWRTDGTPAGTLRVADICAGTCGSSPRLLTRIGDVLYFIANDGVHGMEVWRSQGTAATTRLLKDVRPGPDGSQPYHLTAAGTRLFFSADGGAGRSGLWVSDGSESGTALRAEFAPGPGGGLFNWVAASQSGLFLAVDSPEVAGQTDLWFEELGCSPGDRDGDGIPDCVEFAEGSNPDVKDNDVFADSRLFAMQQYRDFLGREGDAGGIAFWTQQVDAGVSRGQTIESFFDSAEFQGTIGPVARLYFAYFLRVPDYDGITFWAQYYRSNSLLAISNYFAGSPEFVDRYGALDNSSFVSLVYGNVLGRAPDPGGLAFWTGQLDSGALTRGQVMLAFSESAEYQALTRNEVYVTMMYIGMLRRVPEPGGFSFWVDYLDQGSSGLALVNGFLGSAEYRARFLP